MNIRLVQMDIKSDVKYNIENALHLANYKSLENIDILIFPEMFTTGYQLSIIKEIAHTYNDELFLKFKSLAEKTKTSIVLGSIAYIENGKVYNTTFIIDKNGEVISEYQKVHLFKLMDEEKYLHAGNKIHHFKINETVMSSIICYDLRFPELMRKIILDSMAEVVFVPMEWPKPRTELFKSLLKARAIENQCFIVSCNRVGEENNSTFEGASMVIDPYGNALLESNDKESIFDVNIDISLVNKVRNHITSFNDRREDLY